MRSPSLSPMGGLYNNFHFEYFPPPSNPPPKYISSLFPRMFCIVPHHVSDAPISCYSGIFFFSLHCLFSSRASPFSPPCLRPPSSPSCQNPQVFFQFFLTSPLLRDLPPPISQPRLAAEFRLCFLAFRETPSRPHGPSVFYSLKVDSSP